MVEKKHNKNREFAIGSKIDYNGKTYEVVNRASCDACSLKAICSNNDVEKSNSDVSMLRDERIRIFGECSSVARSDGTSVVFKEIPMTKLDNINHNIIIQPLVEANGTVKSLQIKVPINFEIDKWNSNLDKGIVKFKRKWLTLEQIYKLAKDNDYLTNRSAIKEFRDDKLIAIANLMDIARYFNGDWEYDVTKENIGYMIVCDISSKEPNYSVRQIDASANIYCGNIIFKNEADAQYVIDNPNFRTILDKIFKV